MEEVTAPQTQTTSAPTDTKNNKPYVVFITLIIMFLLVGGYVIVSSQNISPRHPSGSSKPTTPQPTIGKNPTFQPTTLPLDAFAGWKTYVFKTAGITFRLPPLFDTYGVLKEEVLQGEVGDLGCMTFSRTTSWHIIKSVYAAVAYCTINKIGIGANSIDFQAGREGGFTDLSGFKIEDDKYYARIGATTYFEIPPELSTLTTNPNGTKILIVRGKNSTGEEWQGPLPGTPGEGKIGALINTHNSRYPGAALEMELISPFTEDVFRRIVSTIIVNNN